MIYETVIAHYGDDSEVTDRMQGVVYQDGFTISDDVLVKYKGKERDIAIPAGVRMIGPSAFAGNPFVKTVIIPAGVTTISRWAFYYCTSLQKVVIPQSVTFIGEEAFRICRMLEEIELPSHLETIEQLTFSGCAFLRKVNMPASVTTLGEREFWGCKRLESVTLGGRVIPPALLNNEFRPPLLKDEPFPAPVPRAIPPEIHVAWRAWLAAAGDAAADAPLAAGSNALDADCRRFLREQGDKVCAALGYDAETLKFIAKNQLITKDAALRAAAECSARGSVEATALLMELAQGLAVDDGLDL